MRKMKWTTEYDNEREQLAVKITFQADVEPGELALLAALHQRGGLLQVDITSAQTSMDLGLAGK